MKLKHESTLLSFLFPTALLTRGSRERFCKVNLYSLGKKGKGEGRKIKDHSMAVLVELWEGCLLTCTAVAFCILPMAPRAFRAIPACIRGLNNLNLSAPTVTDCEKMSISF